MKYNALVDGFSVPSPIVNSFNTLATHPMKRPILATLFAIATFSAVVSGDPTTPASAPPAPAVQQRQIKDPCAGVVPVILYPKAKQRTSTIEGPLLIYARNDLNPPIKLWASTDHSPMIISSPTLPERICRCGFMRCTASGEVV